MRLLVPLAVYSVRLEGHKGHKCKNNLNYICHSMTIMILITVSVFVLDAFSFVMFCYIMYSWALQKCTLGTTWAQPGYTLDISWTYLDLQCSPFSVSVCLPLSK